MTLRPSFLVCLLILLPACPELSEENNDQCIDQLDNDGDGLTDCQEPTCASRPECDASCGDGDIQAGEECDGANLGGQDCVSIDQGFSGGTLGCNTECRFDTNGCTQDVVCGNNIQESGEECDGSDLGGESCTSQGFPGGGTLGCQNDCTFDVSFCVDVLCGNGLTEAGEECDDGAANSDTTPDACRTNCTLPACGDNVADPANQEQCDSDDLRGQDCASLGFLGGTLLCQPGCAFDTSACIEPPNCGNGLINAGEECDDGNQNNNDGCSGACFQEDGFFCQGEPSLCETLCGDFLTAGLEECDDGNTQSGDGCSAGCILEFCGDGIVNNLSEACDNGSANSDVLPGACRLSCQLPSCDDGVVDPGQLCYDAQLAVPTGASPQWVAAGDLDGFNGDDFVTADINDDQVSVLFNDGAGGFFPRVSLAVGDGPISVAIDDFDGVNGLDLAVGNNAAGSVSILLNNGGGLFGVPLFLPSGSNLFPIATGNLDGIDGPDIIAGIFGGSVTDIFFNNAGVFSPRQSLAGPANPFSIAVGDLDGLNGLDFVVTERFGTTVTLFLNDGAGASFTQQSLFVGNNPTSVAVGDMNGDTFPDLVVTNASANAVRVLLNDGTGLGYTDLGLFPCGTNPFAMTIGDLDQNGALDVITAAFGASSVGLLLNDGAGFLGPVTLLPAGSGLRSVAVGDFNGDTALDVVTANQNNNNASVFFSRP